MRGTTFFYVQGVYSEEEAAAFSINVLEAFASFVSLRTFVSAFTAATQTLEFTDNTGAEWAARRERSGASLRGIVESRAAFLSATGHFVRTARVSSAANKWADALSRQRVEEVLAEAVACGLTPVRLFPDPAVRAMDWLS